MRGPHGHEGDDGDAGTEDEPARNALTRSDLVARRQRARAAQQQQGRTENDDRDHDGAGREGEPPAGKARAKRDGVDALSRHGDRRRGERSPHAPLRQADRDVASPEQPQRENAGDERHLSAEDDREAANADEGASRPAELGPATGRRDARPDGRDQRPGERE